MTNPEGQRGSALVKGALVGVALAVAGSSAVCAIEASKGKGPQPTPTPIETPTVNPTATREVTPTPETINLPAVDISEKFLLNIHSRLADKSAFKMKVDAEDRPVNENLPEFVSYASKAWGQKMEVEDLSKDPVKVLKKMIADGANGGVDNVTYHHYLTEGEASGEMRLYRAKLNNFSGGTKEIKLKGSYPSEMVLRQGTDITVVGLTPEGKAIVSFDEGFKRGGSDMAPRSEPKLYFVVMPYEAKDAKPGETSVENLFIENNLVFKDGKISFQKVQGGKTYTWTPNRIDAKMVEALREEAGILWVDKSKDGKFITNPIVPEPSKELVGDKYEVKQDENGDVIAIDGSGKKLAIAKWSEVKEEWEWGPAIPPTPTVLPTPTATKVPEMKPYETKTYSGTANTESKLLNESNISSFYSFVTKEEAQKLAREQDGKLLFPLSPKGQFSMGEYTMNWDGSKIIVAYSSNLDIIAPFDGTVEVSPNGVRVKSNKKGPDGSYYVATFGAYESNLEINLKTGDQAKTGEKMFKFLGSKPAKIDGDMAEANRFTFDIGRWLDYNPPLIIPGGGTKTREVTKITPSLLGKELLVLGKDGKPVIEQ